MDEVQGGTAMKRVALGVLFTLFVVTVLTAFGQAAEAPKVYIVKMANNTPPEQIRTVTMKWFADELEKRSGGRFKVQYFPGGQLGSEQEEFQSTVAGNIHVFRGGGWEHLPGRLNLWGIPFMFRNFDEYTYFEETPLAKQIAREASANGIIVTAVGNLSFRNIQTAKKVIREPEDLKGLKMRVPNWTALKEFYKNLGANVVMMDPTEVYMALQTGVIDGTCNLSSMNYPWKIHEVAKNFTWINYAGGPEPLMTSDKWYNSLPSDLKELYNQVAIEHMKLSDKMMAEKENEYSEKIAAASTHVEKVIAEPALVKRWADASKPVKDRMIEAGLFSQKDYDALAEILEKYRATHK